MLKMRFQPTRKNLGLLVGSFVLLVAIFSAIIETQHRHLTRLTTEAARLEMEISDRRKLAQELNIVHESLGKDREQLMFLETATSNDAYVPTLLKQLEDLAHSTRNRVLSVRPVETPEEKSHFSKLSDAASKGKVSLGEGVFDKKAENQEKDEPYRRLSIQVNFVGTYETTRALLDRITRFPKIIAVEELQIHPYQEPQNTVAFRQSLLTVDLRLTAFIMKQPEIATPKG